MQNGKQFNWDKQLNKHAKKNVRISGEGIQRLLEQSRPIELQKY